MQAMKADGFDDCIIGLVERTTHKPFLAYDADKVIGKLMKRDKMTYEEAMEYFDHNISCAWAGDTTPCFIFREKLSKILERIS